MRKVNRYTWIVMLAWSGVAQAELYSYVNDDGDYVITRDRPSSGEYVVLSDEGEFIERVQTPALDVPVSHWRPWYLPSEPNPFTSPEPEQPPEPSVVIEEVDEVEAD